MIILKNKDKRSPVLKAANYKTNLLGNKRRCPFCRYKSSIKANRYYCSKHNETVQNSGSCDNYEL